MAGEKECPCCGRIIDDELAKFYEKEVVLYNKACKKSSNYYFSYGEYMSAKYGVLEWCCSRIKFHNLYR